MTLAVTRVRSRAEIGRFLALPRAVNATRESLWVSPLDLHVRSMMGRIDAPDRRFLIARRGGVDVARIGVRRMHDALHFGFFECVEGDDEAVGALIDAAHALAPDLPMRGPYHFTLEDPYSGVLVEGFEEPPFFLLPYNPPWYARTLEQAGFSGLKDLHTYAIDRAAARYDKMASRAARARDRGVEVRVMDRRRVRQEVRSIADIFENALAGNWGFEPFDARTLGELELMARFVPERWGVVIARRDGVDVGCMIIIPNFNEILLEANGQLSPGVVWRYLRRQHHVRTYRGFALGVRRDQQSSEVAAALVHHLTELGQVHAWDRFELGWVVEDNARMAGLALAMGARRNKTYRLFERLPREGTAPPVANPS
ncbi:MAG: hypothetical protein EB084_04175 [Proteobacteria bacterium]|nr:hypothetical protein [Pseudomonadota bacterium]